jgi:peptide/nickel transport system substrate-binding protein
MPKHALLLFAALTLASCSPRQDANSVVMIIEASPTNLDPRVGTDAYSERIGKLIFDSLVRRDEHFKLQPYLAERWEIPDPLTYVFYLRRGVRFHDGRPLTARDVKWTFDSMVDGTVITAKASTFKLIDKIEAMNDHTVVFRLKEPYATLLWNVSDGAIGIVPYGSGKDFNRQPIGSGPFKFVSAVQDSEVILARNDGYWGERGAEERIRFAVVPDTTTRALELRKGSADAAINAMNPDMVVALQDDPRVRVKTAPGTIFQYLALNLRDPLLQDVRVRRALAYAVNRDALIQHLWRGLARPAASVLPPEHWAYTDAVRKYPFNPQLANRLLDEAGYPRDPRTGVRFVLTMKTSTEETSRLIAAVLQQQWREIGVALDIRTFEFATFYSDVVKGAFQIYTLRWIGGNEDPDIFEHAFHSASFAPKRANRGYYVNPRLDALIDEGRKVVDQEKRRRIYAEVQKILADDLPYINLWFLHNVLVHSPRVSNVALTHSGNYDFLRTVELAR